MCYIICMPRTYLNGSVKDGTIMRWTINPLIVYIAPMKFYSKVGEDHKYRKMVMDAFSAWQAASGGTHSRTPHIAQHTASSVS